MAAELDLIYNGASATLYAIIRRESDGKVWNTANSAFETWANGTIASYDVALTDNGGDYYSADFPTSITAGQYRVTYYEMAGATPATSDEPLKNESLYWNGSTVDSSPSSDYLTTLAKVKLYLNITGTDQDSFLTNLLGSASRYIEGYLDTKVLSASYTEYQHGTGTSYLKLYNKWLTALTRIATHPMTVLSIRNTSALSSVQRAYVTVSSTGLSIVSTAGATTTTDTFAFATYTTLSSLETAIEAISGWSVEVAGDYSSFASANLRETQYASASDGSVAEIEAYVGELSWDRIDPDTGTIYGYFPYGFRNIEIKYTAGYAAGEVPDDLQNACMALTGGLYRAARGGGGSLKKEKIGDYEYENFDTARMSTMSIKSISYDAYLLLQRFRSPPTL